MWDLCRNTTNIIFYYKTNSVKINDQIFQKALKTLFLAHFWIHFQILTCAAGYLLSPEAIYENPGKKHWYSLFFSLAISIKKADFT